MNFKRLLVLLSLFFILLLVPACDETETDDPTETTTSQENLMYYYNKLTRKSSKQNDGEADPVPVSFRNRNEDQYMYQQDSYSINSSIMLPDPETGELTPTECHQILYLKDGGYIIVEKHYFVPVDFDNPDGGNIYIGLDDYEYIISRFDKDMNVIWTKPILEINELILDYNYVYMDNDEHLYFRLKASSDIDYFAVVSTDGEQLFTIPLPENASVYGDGAPRGVYPVQMSDGQIYVAYLQSPENKYHFVPIDFDKKGYGEENKAFSFDYYSEQVVDKSIGYGRLYQNKLISCEGGSYAFYYYNRTGLYGVDSSGKATELFKWLDVGLSEDMIGDICILDESSIILQVQEEHAGGYMITFGVVSLVPISSVFGEGVTEVPILRIAVDTETNLYYSNVLKYAAKFIRSGGCRVEIVSYADTEGGLSANQKLAHDISKNNSPDIVLFGGGLSYEILADSGVFADLYQFIDKSETFGRDELLPCILKPFEDKNGELFRLVTEFDLMTMSGKKSFVGSSQGWSFGDFAKLNSKLSDEQYLFGVNSTADMEFDMLKTMLPLMLGEFIDYNSGECDFTGLREFLELCVNTKKGPNLYRDPSLTINDTMILHQATYTRVDEFLADRYMYFSDGEGVQVGYPTPDGKSNGTYVKPVTSLAIPKLSKNPELAWKLAEFIVEQKDERIKESIGITDFGVSDGYFRLQDFTCSRKGMEQWVEYAKRREYSFSVGNVTGRDWTILQIESKDIDSTNKKLPVGGLTARMTDADADAFMKLLETADSVYINDPTVTAIILEDASAYFAGTKTLDEAVKLIEDRITTKMAE